MTSSIRVVLPVAWGEMGTYARGVLYCFFPGTPFMKRLQDHLKYFVVNKVTHDPLWQGPKIILSGHEVTVHTNLRETGGNCEEMLDLTIHVDIFLVYLWRNVWYSYSWWHVHFVCSFSCPLSIIMMNKYYSQSFVEGLDVHHVWPQGDWTYEL